MTTTDGTYQLSSLSISMGRSMYEANLAVVSVASVTSSSMR